MQNLSSQLLIVRGQFFYKMKSVRLLKSDVNRKYPNHVMRITTFFSDDLLALLETDIKSSYVPLLIQTK